MCVPGCVAQHVLSFAKWLSGLGWSRDVQPNWGAKSTNDSSYFCEQFGIGFAFRLGKTLLLPSSSYHFSELGKTASRSLSRFWVAN